MAEVGEPKRRIIVVPAEEPVPVDLPLEEPAVVPEPVPEPAPA